MSVRVGRPRAADVRTAILEGFDDPGLGRHAWNRLLRRGQTDVVFLTWEFQRAWWEAFSPGDLLLVAAQRDDEIVAVAPFYSDEWSISFVGQGDADWLDLVGDASDDRIVHALLRTAREAGPRGADFDLAVLPVRNRRLAQLEAAAAALGLRTWKLVDDLAPALDLAVASAAAAALSKKSLVRHERFFRRNGDLAVEHLADGGAILPHLDAFFEQHVARWAGTDSPSEFEEERSREFLRLLTRTAARAGWLRFTRVTWNDRPIAFHYGFSYAGNVHWWRPSFAVDLAHRSPGEVLLRSLLIMAVQEGARVFDFGLGPLPFKLRFATAVEPVGYWGTER